MSVSDTSALQKIIDSKDSSTVEKLKAVELKARLAGRIGTGKGEKAGHEMARSELESFLDACITEFKARKSLASLD